LQKSIFISFILLSVSVFSQSEHQLSVFFETDQAILLENEQKKIDSILHQLIVTNIYEITLTGFCDDRAAENYNMELSKKRAENVNYFFDTFLKNKRILFSSKGHGEIPLDSLSLNNTIEQRRQNRRVDIKIITLPNNNLNQILVANVGDKIILENVYFEINRHKFARNTYAKLDSLTTFFKENPSIKFHILGHVCCRKIGSVDAIDDDTGKRGLSLNRAKAVYDYFARRGIAKESMKYFGMKADYPLGKGDALDRRVELQIIEK